MKLTKQGMYNLLFKFMYTIILKNIFLKNLVKFIVCITIIVFTFMLLVLITVK